MTRYLTIQELFFEEFNKMLKEEGKDIQIVTLEQKRAMEKPKLNVVPIKGDDE